MNSALQESATRNTPARNTAVSFVNVQKTYDDETLVVRNLNLDIPEGEFLTMLGPSGSGKTTTLMMLAGFEPASHGEIYLKSRPINRVPPHRRGIGMVFQNYALFPHMTVNENLAFPLQVRGISKSEIEDRVKKMLAMVELPDMGGRRPGQLSGGQQQRIAVARALVFQPDLVLMDEPLGALDKQLREQMQYEIKRIHERLGVTVVYVTHDQSEALTMSNRIAVFNDGVVQQLATPDDLYERPINSFVAQFIGENNKLMGTVVAITADKIATVRLESGDMVNALAVNVGAKGQPTLLSVRPERIEINPAAGDVDTMLDGHIVEVVYLGDHIRLRLQVAGRDDFIVKLPNKANGAMTAQGLDVRLGWKAADCRALDR
ncbi:ABC transporter ATP-binding protein [Taklimakanibacter lacteus]|uniref:ABC transporter ATP-binding protein n=1 Tax=Taklimakanibacter lacteus TaxID=2268456 RepID=UPI000E661A35